MIKFGKYMAISILVSFLYWGLLYLFTDMVGLWYMLSAIATTAILTVVGFTANYLWTWKRQYTKLKTVPVSYFTKYIAVGGSTTFLGWSLLYILTEYAHLWYMLSSIIGGIIVIVIAFLANNFWTFRESGREHNRQYYNWRIRKYPDLYTNAEIFPYERKNFEDIYRGASILDVGCGGGRVTTFLAKKGCEVVGIDFSENMCRSAVILTKRRKIEAKYVIGDAVRLPFRSNSFDHVLCLGSSLNVLGSTQNIKLALLEMARVLKLGGKLFIVAGNLFSPLVITEAMLWLRMRKRYFVHLITTRELDKYMEATRLAYTVGTAGEYLGTINNHTMFQGLLWKVRLSMALVVVADKASQ